MKADECRESEVIVSSANGLDIPSGNHLAFVAHAHRPLRPTSDGAGAQNQALIATLIATSSCQSRRRLFMVSVAIPMMVVASMIFVYGSELNRRTLEIVNFRYSFNSTSQPPPNPPELDITAIVRSSNCSETFLQRYEQFCEKHFVPRGGSGNGDVTGLVENPKLLCPCVPRDRLLGRVSPVSVAGSLTNSSSTSTAMGKVIDEGGHWSPGDCTARQRLAVVVPCRDRYEHLQTLVRYLHPFLQRQLIDYTIFSLEQDDSSRLFNKAALMNAGYQVIRSRSAADAGSPPSNDSFGAPFDCFLFHDVDMLPEDDRNFYGCGARLPRHVGAYIDKMNYELMYNEIFGGVTSFRPEVFELVNGFSNEFYGWGGEDDDMLQRVKAKQLWFVRFPRCVATYSMIRHNKDARNPLNKRRGKGYKQRPWKYVNEGLSSVKYTLLSVDRLPLYTRIFIKIPPKEEKRKNCNARRKRRGKC